MAYQNFYSNLPGVRASFRDGILSALTPTNSPNIIVLGTAPKGPSYDVYGDDGTNILTSQFGSSDLVYNLTQIKQMIGGTGSVGVVKVGGTQGHVLITKAIASSYERDEVIRITSLRTEDNFFDSVKLILLPFESAGIVRQRVIVIDKNNNALFDSESILTQNVSDFEVSIGNDFGINNILYTPSVYSSVSTSHTTITCNDLLGMTFDAAVLSQMPFLGDLALTDIFVFASNNKTSVGDAVSSAVFALATIDPVSGVDNASYNHLYAAGEVISEKLHQFTSSIFVAPKWHANIMAADISTISPTSESAFFYDRKALGHAFKVMYQGKPYVFMFGRKAAISASNLKAINTDYTYPKKDASAPPQDWLKFFFSSESQRLLGDLLNLVEFHFHESAASTACTEWFFNFKGRIECHIDLNFSFATGPGASDVSIVTPFCTLKLLANSVLTGVASSPIKLRASKVAGDYLLSYALASNEASIISDPFIQTPFDLTGAYVPEEVMEKLLTLPALVSNPATVVAANSQIREVNLAHQAAQLAYKASVIYNATIAIVGLASATDLGLNQSSWLGSPPTFEIDSNQTIRVKKNGTGVLGNKFLYGSTSYRDKSAYGGFILTTGSQLPDAEPYGIDDTDEALDAGGFPIDIGRNLIVVGSEALVSLDLQGNLNSTGGIPTASSNLVNTKLNLASTIAAKVFASAENREPIGPYNGLINNVTGLATLTPGQLNSLAIGRICMVDSITRSISSIRTAALPNSDFTRLSTIRVANRLLRNVREIGLKYIGNTFGPAMQSLQNEIDGYLNSEIRSGMIQGNPVPVSEVYASKLDQIAGRVNVRLRFTPPFALESIQIDMAVQPPANI